MDQSVDRSAPRPAPWLACAIGGSLLLAVSALTVLGAAWVEAQTGARQMPSSPATGSDAAMAHDTPFYREGTFHALVAAVLIGGGLLAYRALRSRLCWRAGPAGFVSEAVLFPAVTPAIESAVALVREWHERPPDPGPAGRLDVRVGVTYGEILLDARGARHGAAINKACRLLGVKPKDLADVKVDGEGAALSGRTRILVDEDAAQEVGRTGGFRFIGYARLRGFTGLHGVYEATWQASVPSAPPAAAAGTGRPAGGTS